MRPNWVSDELFPFKSNFVEIDDNIIHYVDEGSGPTLLMYHGNPTWSFMYRNVILGLRDRFRCVAFDYPGFGLSTPSPHYQGRYVDHLGLSSAFVDRLGIRDAIPFVHDWGGPIGLGVAAREPHRYRGLVIFNTFAWAPDSFLWKAASATLGGPLGRIIVDRGNYLARSVASSHKLRPLPETEAMHYTAPFSTRNKRRATRNFIRDLRHARADLIDLETNLPALSDLPALLFWGTDDAFYDAATHQRVSKLFPKNQTHQFDGVGHFVPSEVGSEIGHKFAAWHEDLNLAP